MPDSAHSTSTILSVSAYCSLLLRRPRAAATREEQAVMTAEAPLARLTSVVDRATNVSAWLRKVSASKLNEERSLLSRRSRTQYGVTAERSQFSVCSTSSSHCWKKNI